jgi:hypothetical protein
MWYESLGNMSRHQTQNLGIAGIAVAEEKELWRAPPHREREREREMDEQEYLNTRVVVVVAYVCMYVG